MALNEHHQYILSIDQGTQTTRCLIINASGFNVAQTERSFKSMNPQLGWVEQDAKDIWNSVQQVIATSMIDSGVHPQEIAAIGISNQRETTVIWDKQTGEPIYNAIGWQSQQSQPLINELEANQQATMIYDKTGLPLSTYFSASKIRWILDHVPGAQQRAEAGELLFGTIDTWLVWKLSGGKAHVTDYTNASRTMLYNIHTLQWDDQLLELFQIPRCLLPTVKTSSEVYAVTQNYQFYGAEVPIAGIAGDQQAALVGQLGFDEGTVKNTYGPGAFILMNTGHTPRKSQNGLVTTIAYCIGDQPTYALEGSIFDAGSALDWLQDKMEMISNPFESKDAALASDNHNEVYMVPAFTGLGAPYWDSKAQGAVFGLTRGTTNNDFIKATLQSLAYQTRDVISIMKTDTGLPLSVLKVDGGASRNTYLMQFQADILNTTIDRAAEEETTGLGAAFLAGLAVGYWKSTAELKSVVDRGKKFEPAMDHETRTKLYQGWQHAVAATRQFSN